MFPSPFPRLFPALRLALAAGLLALAGLRAAADEGGFTATLSTEQKTATGLDTLSAAERTALNELVSRMTATIRQENSAAIAAAYFAGCSEAERHAAGLDRLSPAEQARLNELVAVTLIAHPAPKERPRIRDNEILVPAAKPEIHGTVSMTIGQSSHGGTFRGASLWLDYFDPNTGFGLSVGVASFSGGGFRGYYPGYYGGPGFYANSATSWASPFRNPGMDDYAYGEGRSFQAGASLEQSDHFRRP